MIEHQHSEQVTVKCIYCRREIDGHFFGNREKIVNLTTGKTLAVIGEWNKRKGYLHAACATGIEAEAGLQEKK